MTEVPGLDVPWPLRHAPSKVWVQGGWYCAISMGYCGMNGYVRVPDFSPLRRFAGYHELDVEIHGGLTYGPIIIEEFAIPGTDRVYPRTEKTWDDTQGWVGFDTGHYNDVWDLTELDFEDDDQRRAAESLNRIARTLPDPGGQMNNWTVAKVIEETEWLCSQLQLAEYAISERETNGTGSGHAVQEGTPSSDAGSA